MQERSRRLDILAQSALVLIMLVWGFQQVAIKIGGNELAPIWQAALRSIGATLLLGGLWVFQNRKRLKQSLVPNRYAITLILLFTADFGCLYAGLSLTTVSRGIVLYYLSPVMVVFSTIVFRLEGDRNITSLIAALVALGGMAIVVQSDVSGLNEASMLGDILCVVAAAGWAGGVLLIKHTKLRDMQTFDLLLIQLAGSAIAFPLLSLAVGEVWQWPKETSTLFALGFQVLIGAVFSYLLYFSLLQRYPATQVSAYSFLAPCFGVLFSWLLLGEVMTSSFLLGALVIVISLIWLNVSSQQSP